MIQELRLRFIRAAECLVRRHLPDDATLADKYTQDTVRMGSS